MKATTFYTPGAVAQSSRTPEISRARLRTGWGITAIPVLFLVFDTVVKLVVITPVTESLVRLGYPTDLAIPIGLLELVCLIAYLVPRTSFLGAVLLTGFLGGATATHVRIGDPLFSHIFFPTYIGVLLWVGLFLRDPRLRGLVRL
jgi:hypothetical protein